MMWMYLDQPIDFQVRYFVVFRGVPGPLLSPLKNGIIGKADGLRIWNLDFPPMHPGTGMRTSEYA